MRIRWFYAYPFRDPRQCVGLECGYDAGLVAYLKELNLRLRPEVQRERPGAQAIWWMRERRLWFADASIWQPAQTALRSAGHALSEEPDRHERAPEGPALVAPLHELLLRIMTRSGTLRGCGEHFHVDPAGLIEERLLTPHAPLLRWLRDVGFGRTAPPTPAVAERTPYDVLGVPKTATTAEVRDAYLQAIKLVHPDVNPAAGDPELAEVLNRRSAAINRAYQQLAERKR